MKPLRLRSKLTRLPAQDQCQTTKFDEATGQVYTETTAAIQCSDDSDWTQWRYRQTTVGSAPAGGNDQELQINDARPSKINPRVGPRSLQDCAIRCLLQHISDVTVEMIDSLPLTVRYRVWDAVTRRNALSFGTWKTFSESLRRDLLDPDLFSFNCAILQPRSPLHIYTSPLTSSRFEFMTSLSLSADFSNSDLIKLSDIPNLAVLEIINTTDSSKAFCVGDRLIREWHLAAMSHRAFSVLRLLRLWNFENITNRSLAFLDAFPALAVYDVGGCNVKYHPPPPRGWSQIWQENFSARLRHACLQRSQHFLFHRQDGATQVENVGLLQAGLEEPEVQQSTPHPKSDQPKAQGKMMFIPRAEVPNFLNQPTVASWLYEDVPERRSGKVDTWEKMTYELSPVVGDIRNDADLARAGFDITDQAVVGNALVNSVPMASLRLGPKCHLSSRERRTSCIRTDLLHPLNINKARVDSHGTFEEDSREPTRPRAAKQDRKEQGVMGSKKRKLNDLLNSFL